MSLIIMYDFANLFFISFSYLLLLYLTTPRSFLYFDFKTQIFNSVYKKFFCCLCFWYTSCGIPKVYQQVKVYYVLVQFIKKMEFSFLLGWIVAWILISVPVWPLAILTIHRTFHKWLIFGFVSGLGLAFSDLIYAYLTRSGLVFVQDFIIEHQFWFQLIGSIVFMIVGFSIYLSHKKKHKSVHAKRALFKNFSSAFWLNLINPINFIFFWVVFTRILNLPPKGHFWSEILLFVGVLFGACLWWFGLNFVFSRFKIKVEHLYTINKILWGGIILVSVFSLVKVFL